MFKALIGGGVLHGKLSLNKISVDRMTIKARKAEMVSYYGYKRIKGTKAYTTVSREAVPLNIQLGPGN